MQSFLARSCIVFLQNFVSYLAGFLQDSQRFGRFLYAVAGINTNTAFMTHDHTYTYSLHCLKCCCKQNCNCVHSYYDVCIFVCDLYYCNYVIPASFIFFRRVIAKVCYNLARLLSEILVTEECLARFLQLILQDFPISLARLDKGF